MIEAGRVERDERQELRRAGHMLVAAFWLVQFVEISVFAYAQGGAATLPLLEPRAFILIAGFLLSLGIVETIVRSAGRPLPVRLGRTVAAALAVCLAVVPLNFLIYRLSGQAGWLGSDPAIFAYAGLTWSCFFLAMAGALLALASVHRLRRPSGMALRTEPAPAAETSLWVSRRGETVRIDLSAVEHVAAEGAYVRLHLGAASFLHRETIRSFEAKLDPGRFLRVHRSHLVRVDRVGSIRRTVHGGSELLLRDGRPIPVGRTHAQAVRRRLVCEQAEPR